MLWHRRDYWSHHCAADGTGSALEEDPHVLGALHLVLSEPVPVSSSHAKSLSRNISTCWVACGFSSLGDLKFSHSEHMALTPRVGEAAIQWQKTRRWRRCCTTYHLTQESRLLSPPWHNTLQETEHLSKHCCQQQNIWQSHPCLHLPFLLISVIPQGQGQKNRRKKGSQGMNGKCSKNQQSTARGIKA